MPIYRPVNEEISELIAGDPAEVMIPEIMGAAFYCSRGRQYRETPGRDQGKSVG